MSSSKGECRFCHKIFSGPGIGKHLLVCRAKKEKDDLKKLAKDPKYIPGIYNYCDRWCERCPFTSRCLNCTLVKEQFGDLEKIDELNEAFWEKFSEMLHSTMTMIKDGKFT